jgi:hypothetical protein
MKHISLSLLLMIFSTSSYAQMSPRMEDFYEYTIQIAEACREDNPRGIYTQKYIDELVSTIRSIYKECNADAAAIASLNSVVSNPRISKSCRTLELEQQSRLPKTVAIRLLTFNIQRSYENLTYLCVVP